MDDYGNKLNNMAAYCHPWRPAMMATKAAFRYLLAYRHFYADLH